jgi:hypothetical protein
MPAIESAGLEPYRVDRDPTVTVPIDAIEDGIRQAVACVADITTDNPNVWFELGFALACRKPVVLICSSERTSRFPFDIQHRHIVTYNTDSPSDFDRLRGDVIERVAAAVAKESRVQALAQSSLRDTEGLEPHEIAALVIIAESDLDPDSFPSATALKQDMRKAGYTELATVLAVNSLRSKKLVTGTQVQQFNSDSYTAYCLLEAGTEWLLANRGRLALTEPSRVKPPRNGGQQVEFPDALPGEDDDLPF